MNYSDYLATIEQFLVIKDGPGRTAFESILPTIIALAELRIYREPSLDFLATRTSDSSQVTTAGSRQINLLSQFLVVEGVSLILPANSQGPTAAGASRLPLLAVTRPVLDLMWPQESLTQTPDLFTGGYWALFSEQEDATETPYNLSNTILIAPTPDNVYKVEVTGTFRPAPLSATNQQTVLTEYFWDLFFAASMLAGLAYQRDFGAQSDDPRAAMTWQQVYNDHLNGAAVEEARKKMQGADYSAFAPNPIAGRARAPGDPPAQPGPGPGQPG